VYLGVDIYENMHKTLEILYVCAKYRYIGTSS